MKILNKCEGCNKRKLFIKVRTYRTKVTGKIKSKSELCGKCYRGVKNMIKNSEELS